MRTSTSAFTIKRWDETQNGDWEGGRLTRTLATKAFTGQLEGTGLLEAVILRMFGTQEGVTAHVGLERISGTLEGKTGTFVMVHQATSTDDSLEHEEWTILPGSGTGELHGIRGHGTVSREHELTLHYELGGAAD